MQADITTPWRSSRFFLASCTCFPYRESPSSYSIAALYILKHHAYNRYTACKHNLLDFKTWCTQREQTCPQFHYCMGNSIMEIILTAMYLDALTELTPWFHALDHTNYARWIPVHLRDMAELPTKHLEVAKNFTAGNFRSAGCSVSFRLIFAHILNSFHLRSPLYQGRAFLFKGVTKFLIRDFTFEAWTLGVWS